MFIIQCILLISNLQVLQTKGCLRETVCVPVDTRRHFNVDTTSYRRLNDVVCPQGLYMISQVK